MEILENSKEKDWAKCYRAVNFIEKGVCTYQDEVVYISQETLQKCVRDIKGKPVIIKHQRGINPDNMQQHAVGYVTGTRFDDFSAGFSCDFVLFDEEAKELISKGWSVSCAYMPKAFGQGGTWHNTAYDREITDLEFTHLALVPDPRYEDAKVYENSREEEYENGFITLDEIDETGKRKVIFVPGITALTRPLREWVNKTISDFKEGAETFFDFTSKTRAKIDNNLQREIKNTIKNFQSEYRMIPPIAGVNVTTLGSGCLGVACGGGNNKARTLSLSSQLFSGKYTQDQWENGVKSGFHPKGTGDMVKSVLVHELAHSITAGTESKNKEFWNELEAVRKDYMKNITKKDINNPDFVSNYARTNSDEFIAECFSQAVLSKKPSKYSKQVLDLVNKHFSSSKQMKLELQNKKDDDNNDENIWTEDCGVGYPIDEDSYNKLKEEIETKTDEKQNNKEDEMDVNEFISKITDGIVEKFNACKKNEKEEEIETKIEDEEDDDKLEFEGETYSKKELVNAFKKMKQNEMDEKEKEEKENSLGEESFKKLEELLNSRDAEGDKTDKIKVESQAQRVARGKEIFS